MKRSKFTEQQIVGILGEQEAGEKTADVCRRHAAQLAAMGDRLRATEALRQSPIAPSAQPRQFDRRTPASAG